ncbi:MAG TPA: hypothetical protein VKR81_02030, partial [Candidatus Binatia bacterium]|nr:hypothetical protein [Candidatus Binatia bacterium]
RLGAAAIEQRVSDSIGRVVQLVITQCGALVFNRESTRVAARLLLEALGESLQRVLEGKFVEANGWTRSWARAHEGIIGAAALRCSCR